MTETNGLDGETLKSVTKRIEACFTDLLSERGSYMSACRPIRKKIKEAYADAKAAGIDPKVLAVKLKNRERERAIAASIAAMEADEQETYEMVEEALGDFANTPLGEATLKRTKRGAAKGAAKGSDMDELAGSPEH